MKTTITEPVKIDEKETGVLAYQLWEQAGRPSGKDQDFWFEAENQLRARAKAVVTLPVQIPAARPPTPEVSSARPAPSQAPATPPVKLPPSRNKAAEPAKRGLNRLNTSKPGRN